MLKFFSILFGSLVCIATSTGESLRGYPGMAKAFESASENIRKIHTDNDRIDRLIKTCSVVKLFFLKIKEDDYTLAIATNSYWSWPGNNSFLAILFDSQMDPVDCVLMGGQQIFKTAYFKKTEQELVTYADARKGGIYTQTVKVSSSGLLVAEAKHSEIDFGYDRFVSTGWSFSTSEQVGTDQAAPDPESKSESKEEPKPESEGRPK